MYAYSANSKIAFILADEQDKKECEIITPDVLIVLNKFNWVS